MCDSARLSINPHTGHTPRGRHRIHTGRCLPPLFAAALLLLIGCKGDNKRDVPWGTGNAYVDEDTTVYTLEETGGDSLLVGSAVYHDQAAQAEEVLHTLQDVKSPEMLLHAMEKLDKLHINYDAIDDENEQDRLLALMEDVHATYQQACHDYMMPAHGILQTIATVKGRLQQCNDEASFRRITEVRRGYFRLLPEIHRLVAEPNERKRVHQKATELQKLLDQKKAQFSH